MGVEGHRAVRSGVDRVEEQVEDGALELGWLTPGDKRLRMQIVDQCPPGSGALQQLDRLLRNLVYIDEHGGVGSPVQEAPGNELSVQRELPDPLDEIAMLASEVIVLQQQADRAEDHCEDVPNVVNTRRLVREVLELRQIRLQGPLLCL